MADEEDWHTDIEARVRRILRNGGKAAIDLCAATRSDDPNEITRSIVRRRGEDAAWRFLAEFSDIAPAAAPAVLALAGAGGPAELVDARVVRLIDVLDRAVRAFQSDRVTAATPAEYEEECRRRLPDWLYYNCGLQVPPADEDPKSTNREILHSGRTHQWDFRAPVRPAGTPRPTDILFVYLSGGGYGRPAVVPQERRISPDRPSAVNYVAIAEITTGSLTSELMDRLEYRLRVSISRAVEMRAYPPPACPADEVQVLLDVVAVVALVSPDRHADSMRRRFAVRENQSKWPLLRAMISVRRFVHFTADRDAASTEDEA